MIENFTGIPLLKVDLLLVFPFPYILTAVYGTIEMSVNDFSPDSVFSTSGFPQALRKSSCSVFFLVVSLFPTEVIFHQQ